jgi:lipopolysaccharide transport protein LptA
VPGKKKKHKKAKEGAAARTGRDAVITSERTDYDRKEGIILFDRNVFVDDEQYQMHADRLFVFLDGTNDLKRIVAIGNVSITNEARTASCSRAVFTKAASKIVMYGDENSYARLEDPSQRGGVAEGKKITFWLDAEQVSVEESAVRLPGAALKARDPKKMLEQAK